MSSPSHSTMRWLAIHALPHKPALRGWLADDCSAAEDALVAELGLDLDLKDRLSLSVDGSAQFASNLSSNALTARLNWRF